MIDYGIDDPGRPQAESRYRLITTITDPDAAPGIAHLRVQSEP